MNVVTNNHIRMKNNAINSYMKSKTGVTKYKEGESTITIHKHSGYYAGSDLARIAAARNVQEVKTVSRYVEFKMMSVKKSGASRNEIRTSLRQMEKVLGKAKKKVKGLKKEEQLKAQEKCAEKARKEKLRKRREEEYLEHKRKRQARERNDAATPFPTTGEGARQIVDEAYRRAMETMFHSDLDCSADSMDAAESTIDVTVDDAMTAGCCGVVDAAGAVLDMVL